MGFWSQQELGGSERLWLCNYRPPEVNYSYLCLVPPIWTTQAVSPLSSLALFLAFSPQPLVRPQPPNSEPRNYSAQLCSAQSPARSRWRTCRFFLGLSFFQSSGFSSSFPPTFSLSASVFLFLTLFQFPLPSPCTQPALHTALKRQFPEIFPPWEESSFEWGNQGFNTQVAGNFIIWEIL